MKAYVSNILQALDMFGIHYVLTFDGKLKYKTILGGIITMVVFFFCLSMVYVLGEEVFYKSNPKDLMTILVSPTPPNITFEISTGFLIVDNTSSYIEDYLKYVRFEGNYHVMENTIGIFQELQGYPKKIKLRNCNSSDFPAPNLEQYNLMVLDKAVCYDNSKLGLGGDFSGSYVNYIDMWIKPCLNSTENNFTCETPENILNFLSNGGVYISMHHDGINYNAVNFSKPINKFIIEDNYILDSSISKKIIYYPQQILVDTNQGIFWEDMLHETDSDFEKVKMDFSFNNEKKEFSELEFVEFRFISSINTVQHSRTYLKGTDIIAQIGGLLKILLLLGEYLFYFINHTRMNENLITKLFQIVNEDLQQSPLKEKNKYIVEENPKENDDREIKSSFNVIKHVIPINSKNIENLNLKNDPTTSQMRLNRHEQNAHTIFNRNLEIRSNSVERKQKLNDKIEHINLYFLKRIERESLRLNKIFSSKEYLAKILCCSLCYTKNLKLKNYNYSNIAGICVQYTDILKIVKNLIEIKKLKYVLFNKKQLAVFKLIEDPYYPLTGSEQSNLK